MSRLKFTKPSAWRVFWSLAAAAFAVYIITVVVVYVLGLTTHDGPKPAASNDYVGFLMWDMIFAGPIFALLLWFITVPVTIVIGVLLACLRKAPADEPIKH